MSRATEAVRLILAGVEPVTAEPLTRLVDKAELAERILAELRDYPVAELERIRDENWLDGAFEAEERRLLALIATIDRLLGDGDAIAADAIAEQEG